MTMSKNLTADNYYTEGDPSVQKMLDNTYTEAITINQSFWAEADIDTRFKVGDQDLVDNYYGNLPAFRRKQFYFNRIKRVCNLIEGFQRRNRKSTITVPVEHNDDKASDQWTRLLFNTMKGANCDELLSEGFGMGGVTTGMSLLNVYINYDKDPHSGDIKCDHVPYNSFLIDPYFRKKDFSDCNYIWRRQWLTKDAVKSYAPDSMADFIDGMQIRGNRDGKFQFMAESYNYAMNNLLAFDEYWYKDTREATFIFDAQNGLTREWMGSEEELEQFLQAYPQIQKIMKTIPTVKLILCVEGKTIYNGPNPLGIDRYPFVPILGYYEPNIPYFPWRVQGVVRNLRDSQFLYNRRKVIELDILESQINSGFKYKPTSLVNPRDIFLEGQGKGIAIKQEALMEDVQEIQPAQIPPSMIQLSEMLGQEIQEISGVNEELLGSATDDKAGILSMLRQGAGLTTLQTLFDQLDFSQKLLGEIFLEVTQKNYSYGKIARILGEEPGEEFKYKVFLNYDVRIEEGINTATQRQLQFAQLMHLHEAGVPIPSASLIEAATLQDKEKLVATIQQQEQQQAQQEQMQVQTQLQMLKAQIEKLEGETVSLHGLGIERMSRVEENRSLATQREAEAVENIASARLDKVKAIKELQEMDLNQIQKLLEIVNALSLGSDETEVRSVDNSGGAK